jgi:hypothetical protein
MARTSICFAAAVVALSIGGCFLGDRAADRTLTIYQSQSTHTYTGQFRIDASQLPPGAVKTEIINGHPGTPETRLTIDMNCPIRVVLVPVPEEKPSSGGSTRHEPF